MCGEGATSNSIVKILRHLPTSLHEFRARRSRGCRDIVDVCTWNLFQSFYGCLCEHSDSISDKSQCVVPPGHCAITVNDGSGLEIEDMVPLTVLKLFFLGRLSNPCPMEDIFNSIMRRHSKVAIMAIKTGEDARHAVDSIRLHPRGIRVLR